jgi:hypothetical protein
MLATLITDYVEGVAPGAAPAGELAVATARFKKK